MVSQFINRHCSRKHHNEQVEISLFCTGHLIGWIWKCWNLLFQFCHLIGIHCLSGLGFNKRTLRVSLNFMLGFNFDMVTNFPSAFGITKTSTLTDVANMFQHWLLSKGMGSTPDIGQKIIAIWYELFTILTKKCETIKR